MPEYEGLPWPLRRPRSTSDPLAPAIQDAIRMTGGQEGLVRRLVAAIDVDEATEEKNQHNTTVFIQEWVEDLDGVDPDGFYDVIVDKFEDLDAFDDWYFELRTDLSIEDVHAVFVRKLAGLVGSEAPAE